MENIWLGDEDEKPQNHPFEEKVWERNEFPTRPRKSKAVYYHEGVEVEELAYTSSTKRRSDVRLIHGLEPYQTECGKKGRKIAPVGPHYSIIKSAWSNCVACLKATEWVGLQDRVSPWNQGNGLVGLHARAEIKVCWVVDASKQLDYSRTTLRSDSVLAYLFEV